MRVVKEHIDCSVVKEHDEGGESAWRRGVK